MPASHWLLLVSDIIMERSAESLKRHVRECRIFKGERLWSQYLSDFLFNVSEGIVAFKYFPSLELNTALNIHMLLESSDRFSIQNYFEGFVVVLLNSDVCSEEFKINI